jgi:molybdopterin molybdotransferase
MGRALAEDLPARATLPPWDNSAMDGYAARAEDVEGASPSAPRSLCVVGVIHAGDTPNLSISEGEATRIMTGAPVPPGADTVIRVEDTDAEAEPGTVRILKDRDVRRNIRPAGEDMRLGDIVLEQGHTVTPGSVGLLHALGRNRVEVGRRPRVAILPTGNELRELARYDEVRAGAGIPETNGPMLAAAVTAAGGAPHHLGIGADDPEDLRAKIVDAAADDVLVTIGGASMGEMDLVKRVLDEIGFELDFWRVRLRPGGPFSFGHIVRDGVRQPVFGLPGNPTSAFVTFELFVRPFLLAMAGHSHIHRRRIRCVAAEPLPARGPLTYFLRVSLDPGTERPYARLAGPQGSGLLGPLANADGFAIVPESVERIEAGEPVEVMLIDDGLAAVPRESLG